MGGRRLSPAGPRRVGVLGGTFDPPHFAHLAVAEQVREALDLETVLFVPAGQPVHKPASIVSSAAHRLRMVELAVAGNPGFRLDRREVERDRPSYSVLTMAELTAEQPAVEFVFVVSTEAVRELPSWREPQRLLELCRMAVVPRSGQALPSPGWLEQHFPGRTERFLFVETTHLGHSASDIRARVAAHRSIRYLVPSEVERYIRENRLYLPDD